MKMTYARTVRGSAHVRNDSGSACFHGRIQLGFALVAVLAVIAGLSSCSTTKYRKAADRETYQLIQEKSPAVPGMSPEFSIETEGNAEAIAQLLAGLPRMEQGEAFLGADGGGEQGAAVLSLEQALGIAVSNSRTYQDRKESLYLEFLGLTLERHNYTPIFSGGASGGFDRSTSDGQEASAFSQGLASAGGIVQQIEAMTGRSADLLNQYQAVVREAGAQAGWDDARTVIVDDRRVSGQTRFGIDKLMKGGGRIALGLTSNFLRFLAGDPSSATSSTLSASFTQPLLEGAGSKVAAERLTQAERDALYALREFTRFRMAFTVDICSSYYGVLEDREVARNNWQSLESFKKNLARQRAFTEESRDTQTALGRLEQAQLSTENNWTNSIRRYRESLDRFKIQLGLSTDAALMLNPDELKTLRERGILHPELSAEDAVKVAVEARLDLYNARDQADDAERRVVVAADALKPRLNLVGGAQVSSNARQGFEEVDFQRGTWSAGLEADLPLDNTSERNAYRASLIASEQAKRASSLAQDNVKLDVRGAWRTLDQARSNYAIAEKGVELNQRRVEEQELLAELGRATAQNLVDAQNDLTGSQNELVSALVSHTIARLAFWRDMGILYIKDNGQWEEVKDEGRS